LAPFGGDNWDEEEEEGEDGGWTEIRREGMRRIKTIRGGGGRGTFA
jgi:hypothetical protein